MRVLGNWKALQAQNLTVISCITYGTREVFIDDLWSIHRKPGTWWSALRENSIWGLTESVLCSDESSAIRAVSYWFLLLHNMQTYSLPMTGYLIWKPHLRITRNSLSTMHVCTPARHNHISKCSAVNPCARPSHYDHISTCWAAESASKTFLQTSPASHQ